MSKSQWKTACIIALSIFGIFASVYSMKIADEYGRLYDEYKTEKATVKDRNNEITDLKNQIKELQAALR